MARGSRHTLPAACGVVVGVVLVFVTTSSFTDIVRPSVSGSQPAPLQGASGGSIRERLPTGRVQPPPPAAMRGAGDTPLQSALAAAASVAIAPPAFTLPQLADMGVNCSFAADLDFKEASDDRRRTPFPIPDGQYRLMVVSTGGSATTYLERELHQQLAPYGYAVSHTHFKHRYGDGQAAQEAACSQPDRIIYLFNDPLDGLLSLGRRGILAAIARSFSPWDYWAKTVRDKLAVCRFVIDAVDEQRRDVVGRHQHMLSWLAMEVPAPILFINTNTLLANPTVLADFLGVPPSVVSTIQSKPSSNKDTARSQLPRSVVDVYTVLYTQMRLYDHHIRIPEGYDDRVPRGGLPYLGPVTVSMHGWAEYRPGAANETVVCDHTPSKYTKKK